jgi:hypothetical protein
MALEGSHEENIIINGTLLTGVQNVSFSQNVSENPVSMLGNDFAGTTISNPTTVTAAVDKFLLNSDFVTGLTGLTTISGQFEYGDNYLNFSQAVLNSYAVSASVGELPQISFDLSIYGSLSGSNESIVSSASNENAIENVSQSGLIVTFDKNETNAIQSFSFSETFNVQPIYGLGQNTPAHLSIIGPIAQEATISIEVEDYELEETFSFLSGSKDRNRTIQLQISGNNGVLNTFALENAHLVSESITAGAGDTIVANLSYRGFKKV